jgi:N-acetyl-anhydromuramyl-L-alanine amidase AmpD
VIHTTEYDDWFTSVQKLRYDMGKSVHYLIGRDGHIAQFIPERYVAWHAGNSFVNLHSIGIEHVGLLSEAFQDAQYGASAQLVRYLISKYKMATDRVHIIGHAQVPDPTALDASSPPCEESLLPCQRDDRYGGIHHHRDPGELWDWDGYMARLAGAQIERVDGSPATVDGEGQ